MNINKKNELDNYQTHFLMKVFSDVFISDCLDLNSLEFRHHHHLQI